MKKLAIVGTNGLPGRYGGWDQLLNNLTLKLNEEFEIYVYTSSYNAVKGLKEFNGAKLIIVPFKANGFQSVIYDGVSMFHAVIKFDIILVLGTSGCIFFPIIKLFNKKLILNPDGAEWKRGKWNKYIKWFLKKSEHWGVKYADFVIADNEIMKKYLDNEYFVNSILIEYGGDNVKFINLSDASKSKFEIKNRSYAFKVCRIVPENNIDLILESFSKIDLKLIIVGNWNFSSFGINLRKKYSQFSNILLLDPIYDQITLDELRSNCKVYIHGHSVGGTNPSLVEAMSLGLCCLVFDVDYNRVTTAGRAIYFRDSIELIEKLNQIDKKIINFDEIGSCLKEVASSKYLWNDIIQKYRNILE